MTNLSASDQNHLGFVYPSRYRVMPQGMMMKAAFLIMLGMLMASCQHISPDMDAAALVSTSETSSLELESSDPNASADANEAASAELSTAEPSPNEYTFVEGRGYIVTWPPEERFVISAPDHIRKQMATKCANEGYITAFITSMELHDDQIIGYFLCRGVGG